MKPLKAEPLFYTIIALPIFCKFFETKSMFLFVFILFQIKVQRWTDFLTNWNIGQHWSCNVLLSDGVNPSPLCDAHESGEWDKKTKKDSYAEGARPGLRPSYPERNFQKFCTDNVLLKHPSDFVTIGHIKPNIHLGKHLFISFSVKK